MTDATAKQIAAFSVLRAWLWIVTFLVFALVILGGVTRLTDLGLSITEWQPLLGIVPPLGEADWQAAFEKYRQSSEYLLQNRGMSFAQFKVIFWWEWAHRLLARAIGLVFALPLLAFVVLRRIEWKMLPGLLALLVLGGLQGGLGWFMVQSGLAGRVDVSQYRLAAHLTLAAFILAMLAWTALGVGIRRRDPRLPNDWLALLILLLVLVQVVAGGFVAGLDAGMGYNTWPLMEGRLIPEGLLAMQPAWRNLFENALTIQFNHRLLAYAIVALMTFHAWSAFTIRSWVLFYFGLIQVVLGVWTLLWQVPLPLALLHQAVAMLLLVLAVWNFSGQLKLRPETSSATGGGQGTA